MKNTSRTFDVYSASNLRVKKMGQERLLPPRISVLIPVRTRATRHEINIKMVLVH